VLQTNGSGVLSFASSSATNTPAFFARRSGNQSCPNNAGTIIIFDNEIYDTDSAYNTTNGKFTVPSGKGGKYFVGVNLRFDNSISGRSPVDIKLNGGGSNFVFEWNVSQYGTVGGSAVMSLTAGDYLEIEYYHATGGAINVRIESFFTAFKLIE
jgi:hypothetical protein